jgi:hypothetical protein
VRRFEVLSGTEALELRDELDGELTALRRHFLRLRADSSAEVLEAGGDFPLRQALAKLMACEERLTAVTFLETELGIGRPRKTYEDYASAHGEAERFWREIEEEERRARSGEASGASA